MQMQNVEPTFRKNWEAEIRRHHESYKAGDYENAIRGLVSMYSWTFDELKAETDTRASKEWDFNKETADYFFLAEDFDPETGEFLR